MNNLLTAANLEAGICQWWQKRAFPSDFHHAFYKDLRDWKQDGLSQDWWRKVVGCLSRWRAIRPYSRNEIFRRGLPCLADLQAAHDRIVQAGGKQEPSLASVSWEHVSELYRIAHSIKETRSPVFGSKLAHFILPNVFPVVDREVIGITDRRYQEYWQMCQEQWVGCAEREMLIERLRQAIGADADVHYPWSSKVTELCLIGSRFGRAGKRE